MVAVVIGLVITIVVSQVFLGNKDAFRTQDDASRIAENARFLQLVLNRTIRNTGYAYWNPNAGAQFKSAWTGKTQLAGQNATGPGGSDEVTVSFYGSSQTAGGAEDGTVLTCHGVGVSDDTTIQPAINRFYRRHRRRRPPGTVLQVRLQRHGGEPRAGARRRVLPDPLRRGQERRLRPGTLGARGHGRARHDQGSCLALRHRALQPEHQHRDRGRRQDLLRVRRRTIPRAATRARHSLRPPPTTSASASFIPTP